MLLNHVQHEALIRDCFEGGRIWTTLRIGGVLEVAASAAPEEVSGNFALAPVLGLKERSALPTYLICEGFEFTT